MIFLEIGVDRGTFQGVDQSRLEFSDEYMRTHNIGEPKSWTYEVVVGATNGLRSTVVASDANEERDRVTVKANKKTKVDRDTDKATRGGGSVARNSLNFVA